MIAEEIVLLAQDILTDARDVEQVYLSRDDALRLCRAIVAEASLHNGAWLQLDSSNLDRCRYSLDSGNLEIVFKSGGRWLYREVPPEVYSRLAAAESAGSYFSQSIKTSYVADKSDTTD
jgi:hypothetical protein